MRQSIRGWQGGMAIVALLTFVGFTAVPVNTAHSQVPIVGKLFSTRVQSDPNGNYTLTEAHGPWMILAATFGGTEGAKQAQALVVELRRDYQLSAYTYTMNYDYTGQVARSATPDKKMRYANSTEYESTAVLIGDFMNADDERMKTVLDKVKYMQPKALDFSKTGTTAQRYAAIRKLSQHLKKDEKKKGLMGSAFVTRNPLLPEEYFDAPVVDGFVRQLNANVEHSLLKCSGKYTVIVATFEGKSVIDMQSTAKIPELEPDGDRLDKAAYQAHRLTDMLRKEKVEAYEFHDRYRSIVTVGSFDSLGESRRDGSFAYTPRSWS